MDYSKIIRNTVTVSRDPGPEARTPPRNSVEDFTVSYFPAVFFVFGEPRSSVFAEHEENGAGFRNFGIWQTQLHRLALPRFVPSCLANTEERGSPNTRKTKQDY
jgi:hypothetical protein